MIEINNITIMDDVQDIMLELRKQLEINGTRRFAKFIDSGDNLMTNCPFHKGGQEKKPSFGIYKKDGTCHCFGCGWAGSLSEVISNCFGKDDFGRFGDKWLIKNFTAVAVEERADVFLDCSRDCNNNLDIIHYVSEEELDSYRYYHPYMYKRKLTNEIIELFDIGYDKNTDCITFPNRDISGKTLFIARRSVCTKFFNYPQGVDKPVYGLYEITKLGVGHYKYDEIIICESMIDALTCWVYGKYAVALNGLGTKSQFETLSKLPVRKYILATDMDSAGLEARKKLHFNLKTKLVTEYTWDLNVAKDINDMSKDYFDSLEEIW